MGTSASCKNSSEHELTTNNDTEDGRENPFDSRFTKKERTLIYETFQRLGDPKKLVGEMFLDLLERYPELRPLFGVNRTPKATMLKMPKAGAHVVNLVTFMDQVTSTLGLYENPLGTWQFVKKSGRIHGSKVKFLQQKQVAGNTEYFSIFCNVFSSSLMPYLTGDSVCEPAESQGDKENYNFLEKKYTKAMIDDVWQRFWTVIMEELYYAFLKEFKRTNKKSATTIMVPMAENEEKARKEKHKSKNGQLRVDFQQPEESGSKPKLELMPDIDDLEDDDD